MVKYSFSSISFLGALPGHFGDREKWLTAALKYTKKYLWTELLWLYFLEDFYVHVFSSQIETKI